ncbi:hypothetical protein [Peribacillus sp. NPDC097895]|uniref:hypothetical protein n=1 Tax=Peribacillus sp. NPDC097895 TaxID=3390619 RepID=UPI003CFE29CF
MIMIDTPTDYEDNNLKFAFCKCKPKPLYMYAVNGEYQETLFEFWKGYNVFPLRVIQTKVIEIDDLHDDDKRENYRINVINSNEELNSLLNEVGWKLYEGNFYITNSFKEVKFVMVEEEFIMGKEFILRPVFELGENETLTEVFDDGLMFTLGTNDKSLFTKDKVRDVFM